METQRHLSIHAPGVATQEATHGDSNWLTQLPTNEIAVAIRMQAEPADGYRATALPVSSPAGSAPEWVHLLPSGRFHGRDGRGPYVVDVPGAVIAATWRHFGQAHIPLDYNHQTELSAQNGQPAPAAGWITNLEARPDGVWAQVDWTEAGARAVAAREFRYVSPVFYHDEEGHVLLIQSAALTNLPNLDLKALSSRQAAKNCSVRTGAEEHHMDFKKAMAQALGLSAEVGEADAIAAAASLRQRVDNPDPAKFVPMTMHESVSAELATLKAAQARAQSEALVSAAQAAGKLTPAMLGWAADYAAASPEGFKAWMEAAPNLQPGSGQQQDTQAAPPKDSSPTLNESQKAVCAACGIKPEDYLKEVAHGRAD